jgi:hypothetical protein
LRYIDDCKQQRGVKMKRLSKSVKVLGQVVGLLLGEDFALPRDRVMAHYVKNIYYGL